MQTFIYTALQRSGERETGEIRANSKAEVFRQLDRQGLQPLSVKLKDQPSVNSFDTSTQNLKKNASISPSSSTQNRTKQHNKNSLTKAQLVTFTDELSELIEAGLQLEPALRIMEQRRELSRLKPVIKELRNKVREGISFSSALRSTSTSFDELFCNLVKAGELSGTLHIILRRQAAYLANVNDLQNRVVQSLLYPTFITTAGVCLVIFFITFPLPQLKNMFSQTSGNFPFVTRLLIQTSEFFISYWFFLVTILMALGISFFAYTATAAGKRWWDQAKLRLPLFGAILATRFYAQFAYALSTLIGNGIPLLNALRLVNSCNTNTYLHECLQKVTDAVAEGGSLSRALLRFAKFPPVFIDIVVIGEQTGDLAASLQKIASRYDRELERRIKLMTSLIQPTIITLLAIFVGLIAYSIISAIFELSSGLRPGRLR
jgi:type II secretory pathway component PulF